MTSLIQLDSNRSICLLPFSDTVEQNTGRIIKGNHIYDLLSQEKNWYVRRRLLWLKEGSILLFYQAKAGVRGYAIFETFSPISPLDATTMKQLGIERLKAKVLCKDWHTLNRAVQLRPLVNDLKFIRNKQNWGASLRTAFLEIPQSDFKLIMRQAS
jgi:hypothetical protein